MSSLNILDKLRNSIDVGIYNLCFNNLLINELENTKQEIIDYIKSTDPDALNGPIAVVLKYRQYHISPGLFFPFYDKYVPVVETGLVELDDEYTKITTYVKTLINIAPYKDFIKDYIPEILLTHIEPFLKESPYKLDEYTDCFLSMYSNSFKYINTHKDEINDLILCKAFENQLGISND
jgi:hypothetical protein